jgi:hypothetical protein
MITCRVLFLKILQNTTYGIGFFLDNDGEIKLYGISHGGMNQTPVNFYWRVTGICSNFQKIFLLNLLKCDLYIIELNLEK